MANAKLTNAALARANDSLRKTNISLHAENQRLMKTLREYSKNQELMERLRDYEEKLNQYQKYVIWAQNQMKIKDSIIVCMAGQVHDFVRLDDMNNSPAVPYQR